jgi:hypothetical protein
MSGKTYHGNQFTLFRQINQSLERGMCVIFAIIAVPGTADFSAGFIYGNTNIFWNGG